MSKRKSSDDTPWVCRTRQYVERVFWSMLLWGGFLNNIQIILHEILSNCGLKSDKKQKKRLFKNLFGTTWHILILHTKSFDLFFNDKGYLSLYIGGQGFFFLMGARWDERLHRWIPLHGTAELFLNPEWLELSSKGLCWQMHYSMEAPLPDSTYAVVHSMLTENHPLCYQSQEQLCEFHLPRANLACHHLYKWHCWKCSLDPYTNHLSSLKTQRFFFFWKNIYACKSSHCESLYGPRRKKAVWRAKGHSLKRNYSCKGLNISPSVYLSYLCICVCACMTAVMIKGREKARRHLYSIENWGQKDLATHKTNRPQGCLLLILWVLIMGD